MYGSDSKLAKELRSFKGGQLKFNQIGNEKYCPQDPSKIVKNGSKSQVTIAFLAGKMIIEIFVYDIEYFLLNKNMLY